jgi:hypothetical protein
MRIEILTFAGALAVAFCTAFCIPRAVHMNKEGRHLAEYVWYTIGVSAVGLVLIGWAQSGDQYMAAQRVLLFIVGALIGGCALLAVGEWIRPVAAQQPQPPQEQPVSKPPPTVNIGPSINTTNQSGGTNTINVGTTRLIFDPAIGEALIKKLPAGRPINLLAVGSGSDLGVAAQYERFLQSRGVQIADSTNSMMLMPPPDHPITVVVSDRGVFVTIAPSAR